MRVKVVCEDYIDNFENSVDKQIKKIEDNGYKIVDIKFSIGEGYKTLNTMVAMILYEVK